LTFFERIPPDRREHLLARISLNPYEIPVLVLSVTTEEAIINTTDRFVRLTDTTVESLAYADFGGHKGFDSMILGKEARNLKTSASVIPFALTRRNGETIHWPVPTGAPGFAFWNVTKHCERIGRRYILKTGE